MGSATLRHSLRTASCAFLLAVLVWAAGCSSANPPTQNAAGSPAPQSGKQAAEAPAAPAPTYTRWVVYINDDATNSSGGMTYAIALNLNAVHDGSTPSGKYTGTTTAKTSTKGNVGGAQLNADAIANSGTLQFTLKATDPSQEDTAGGVLAPLTNETTYSGSGTITMHAAGSASVGPAHGGFANTSGQKITLVGSGPNIMLSVVISGHRYDFKGTIRGE